MIMIGDAIKGKIVQSIIESDGFAILTDKKTQISNTKQLATFVKYFDSNLGNCSAKFLNVATILKHFLFVTKCQCYI